MSRSIGLLLLSAVSVAGTLNAQSPRVSQSCVTVVDAADGRGVAGARVTRANTPIPSTSTDATGRGCFPGSDSVEVRVDAVGYMPVNLALGTIAAPRVRVQPLIDGMMPPEWGSRQVVAALTQSLRTLEAVRDTDAAPLFASVLQRAESTPPSVSVVQDSTGMRLVGYVDLANDGSKYGEVRMFYSKARTIVLGLTTQHCTESCTRERDVAVSWNALDGGGWVPAFAALQGAGGAVTRVELEAPAAVDTAASSQPAEETAPAADVAVTRVRGVIKGDKGRLLPGIEVFSADGSASTVTNERGQYALSMRLPPGGALLTTRRIGWAPSYRTVMRQDGAAVEWSPVLSSTTVLAERVVRATGVPDMLKSWRYNDFLTHRARGVGQFFMTEEIWNSISLGDVLNHGHGIRVAFSYGNNISRIDVPSCIGGAVGVFVNGNDETAINEIPVVTPEGVTVPGENSPQAVLGRFVTSAIVAMELYTSHLQIPPEFANPKYCAVIALWTR